MFPNDTIDFDVMTMFSCGAERERERAEALLCLHRFFIFIFRVRYEFAQFWWNLFTYEDTYLAILV